AVRDGGQQVALVLVEAPVEGEPGVVAVDRRAVGVVVAVLGAGDLVTGGEHRRARRQQQRPEQVAAAAAAGGKHLGVVGRALDARVPRAVVPAGPAVVLAVRLVVLDVGGGA